MGRTSDFQRGKVELKALDCVVIMGVCGPRNWLREGGGCG